MQSGVAQGDVRRGRSALAAPYSALVTWSHTSQPDHPTRGFASSELLDLTLFGP